MQCWLKCLVVILGILAPGHCDDVAARDMDDVCSKGMDRGPCKNFVNRWYYDAGEKLCKPFIYGGCLGNGNQFSTQEECTKTCGKKDTCQRCCPYSYYLECPAVADDACEDDWECPGDQVCCRSTCGRMVCTNPAPCCCSFAYDRPGITNRTRCKDDSDCNGPREKCCANYHYYGYYKVCWPAYQCPCHNQEMCCPRSSQDCDVERNPKCSNCDEDQECPHNYKCCADDDGCFTCTRAYICGPDKEDEN